MRDLAAFADADATNYETLENQLSFAIKTAPKLTIQGGTTAVCAASSPAGSACARRSNS